MVYETPTIERLGDYEMDRVQGEGIVWAISIAVVILAAAKYLAAANIVVAANVAAAANVVAAVNMAWKWTLPSRRRR